jgi:hypothetical protein
MINSTDASHAQPPAAGRSGLASPRAAPWRDMTRPTPDEMYYDAMKARPTRNPPSAWLRLDWFVSADADCNECLQNMTSGKCQKTHDSADINALAMLPLAAIHPLDRGRDARGRALGETVGRLSNQRSASVVGISVCFLFCAAAVRAG